MIIETSLFLLAMFPILQSYHPLLIYDNGRERRGVSALVREEKKESLRILLGGREAVGSIQYLILILLWFELYIV